MFCSKRNNSTVHLPIQSHKWCLLKLKEYSDQEVSQQDSFFFFFNFWPHWVFIAVHRLSLVVSSGGHSSLQCAGFSL